MNIAKELDNFSILIDNLYEDITCKANSDIVIKFTELQKMLIQSIELKMPIDIVLKLIKKGANIHVSEKNIFDEIFPLTRAIRNGLDIEYIKILDTTYASPIYKIYIINRYKPSDEVVTYLLTNIDFYLEKSSDDSYVNKWEKEKWLCDFWKADAPRYYNIIEPFLFTPRKEIKQVVGRAIRSKSHVNFTLDDFTLPKKYKFNDK